jgi:hypothetical protein
VSELFKSAFAANANISAADVLLRLVVALLCGGIVAGIYLRSSRDADIGPSFPVTLVLLAVLIAMVTQVIGNNIARAFSLVGALSIVRFRTIVRDTRDTAYVIFAVVVGMAIGAADLWVAALGIGVIGVFSLAFPTRWLQRSQPPTRYLLKMRVGVGHTPDSIAGVQLHEFFDERQFVSVATNKMGAALDYTYEVELRRGQDAGAVIRAFSMLEGIQDLRLERYADGG